MTIEARFCGSCGAPLEGRFCGECSADYNVIASYQPVSTPPGFTALAAPTPPPAVRAHTN